MDLYARHPFLYQMAHPWHWLTYGNNAAGVAAVATAAGIYGLWRYVVYTKKMMEATKKMMEAAVATRDAEYRPHLVFRWKDPRGRDNYFRLRNAGRGAAITLCVIVWWGDEAKSRFGYFQEEMSGGHLLGNLLLGEAINTSLSARELAPEQCQLLIFWCIDIASNLYQLHILRKMDASHASWEALWLEKSTQRRAEQ